MAEERETRNQQPESREGVANYRADRDDFGRLLYLVFQEIRAQRKASEKPAS